MIIKSFHVYWYTNGHWPLCVKTVWVKPAGNPAGGTRMWKCGIPPVMTIKLNDISSGTEWCLEHGLERLRELATEMDAQEVPAKEKAS